MPLTREQTKYVPSNDTVFLPTVAVDSNLGVRGTSVFDGNAVFNNGINVTAGNSVFSGPVTNLSGLITTNLLASGQVTVGTSTPLAQLTVIPNSISTRGLLVRGIVGQTADLFRIENSLGSPLFAVTAFGTLTAAGDISSTGGDIISGGAIVGTASNYTQFGKYLAVSRFDSNSGFQGTVIRSINPNAEPFVIVNSSNNPTFAINGQGEISNQNNNAVTMTTRATPNTSVTVNTITGNGSAVTYDTQTTSANRFVVGSAVTVTGASTGGFNGTFIVTSVTNSAFTVASTITGTSSGATATSVGQVGDLVQYKNPAGTIIGGRNSVAQIYSGSTTTVNTQVGGAVIGGLVGTGTVTLTLTSASNLAVGDQIVVTGFTPAGYNGTHIVTAVSNTPTFSVTYATPAFGSFSVFGIVSTPAQNSVIARSAGTIGQIIRGATSQVSNLQEWQDSTGAQQSAVASDGTFSIKQIRNIGGSVSRAVFSDLSSSLIVNAANTNYIGLQVRRFNDSQTSDLQQWTNNNGTTVYSRVDKDGALGAGSIIQTTAKTSAYQLTTTDANTVVQMNGAFAFNVDTSLAVLPLGTNITLVAQTAGVTVATTANATVPTINATPGLRLRAAWSTATLIKMSAASASGTASTWLLTGDLTA